MTMSSSSPAGAFAFAPEGPWTPTLALTVAAGGTTPPSFLYRDTRAGTSVVTAAAPGYLSASQPVTVGGRPALALTVAPAQAKVRWGTSTTLTARATDSFGNRRLRRPRRGPWRRRQTARSRRPSAHQRRSPARRPERSRSPRRLPPRAGSFRCRIVLVPPPPRIRVTRAVRHRRRDAPRDGVGGRPDRAVGQRRRGECGAVPQRRLVCELARRHGHRRPRHVRAARTRHPCGCYTTRVRRGRNRHAWVPGTPANRFCKRTPPRRP